MNRMSWLSGLMLVLAFCPSAPAGDKGETKRILLITESRGFRHGCVTRGVQLSAQLDSDNLPKVKDFEFRVEKKKDGARTVQALYIGRVTTTEPFEVMHEGKVFATVKPCVVEVTFQELGKKNNFEVTCSQNSREEIDNLNKYDAVFFFTTGELPISDGQKSDLLSFVRSGKGFGGSHCAADTFYKWEEYGDLIGAYFAGHPPGFQKIRIIVEDKNNPATKHLGDAFDFEDEIYQFKTPYSRDKLHVLLRIDMNSTKNLWRPDGDNPLSWMHRYGKGRVFYTALGHREEVWRDERFQRHLIGGLRFMFGLEDADTTPSAEKK